MEGKREKLCLRVIVVTTLFLSLFISVWKNNLLVERQKRETRAFVQAYCEILKKDLESQYNYTSLFTGYLQSAKDMDIKNTAIYKDTIKKQEVLDVLVKTPEEIRQSTKDSLKEKNKDENYPYRLATMRKEYIVHGPIRMNEYGQEVFLTVLPIYNENELICCVAVVLDSQKVVDFFNLEELSEIFDLEYQLWTVSSETGHKVVLETSDPHVEFMDVVQNSFEMPAQWTLMVKPKSGWGKSIVPPIARGVFIGFLLAALFYFYYENKKNKQELDRVIRTDLDTQFLNFHGFIEVLEKSADSRTVFVIEMYPLHKIFNIMTMEQRRNWMEEMTKILEKYCRNKTTVVSRLQSFTFSVAFEGVFDSRQITEIERELEIELIRSFEFDGERVIIQPIIKHFYSSRTDFEKELEKVQKEICKSLS